MVKHWYKFSTTVLLSEYRTGNPTCIATSSLCAQSELNNNIIFTPSVPTGWHHCWALPAHVTTCGGQFLKVLKPFRRVLVLCSEYLYIDFSTRHCLHLGRGQHSIRSISTDIFWKLGTGWDFVKACALLRNREECTAVSESRSTMSTEASYRVSHPYYWASW
jgi:hypothetical protein